MNDPQNPLHEFTLHFNAEKKTTGLMIWSDVFLQDSDNGDNIAIILTATQGMFDSKNTTIDNLRIISLSTLISSMQIFNLSNKIQEDKLQYLQVGFIRWKIKI